MVCMKIHAGNVNILFLAFRVPVSGPQLCNHYVWKCRGDLEYWVLDFIRICRTMLCYCAGLRGNTWLVHSSKFVKPWLLIAWKCRNCASQIQRMRRTMACIGMRGNCGSSVVQVYGTPVPCISGCSIHTRPAYEGLKSQWCRALVFPLLLALTSYWTNSPFGNWGSKFCINDPLSVESTSHWGFSHLIYSQQCRAWKISFC